MSKKEDTDNSKTQILSLELLQSLDGADFPINQKKLVFSGMVPFLVEWMLHNYRGVGFSYLMLEKVCKNTQLLVDVYVSYFCDPEAPNLTYSNVTTMFKVAQGAQNAESNTVAVNQTTSIRGSSLQFGCLVNILQPRIDREKSKRRPERNRGGSRSPEEDLSRGSEEATGNFEKAESHDFTMAAAISEFNRQPVTGIENLISIKLAENTPASIAQILRNTPSLDKAMIGEYLKHPSNIHYLCASFLILR